MNKVNGVLAIAAALLVMVGTSGCQSGWKFSNPFSRAPKASHAEAPEELDDDFADTGEITPPPENYTVGDATSKKEKTSIAQKGKYDEKADESSVATSVATSDATSDALAAEPEEDYRTPSYARDYQSAAGNVAATQSYARQNTTPESLADTVAAISPDASVAASQPYVPQNAASTQLYSSNENAAALAANTPAPAQAPAADPYPTAPNAGYASNPIAQVSGAQAAPQTQNQPTSVAFNYDPNVPAANTAANAAPAADSDPYSNVIYTPQTASGGFAPGSVVY